MLVVAKTVKLAPAALVKLNCIAPPPLRRVDPIFGGVTAGVVKLTSAPSAVPSLLMATVRKW